MRHSSFLEINLGLMARNFQLIQELAPKATILPMVKANAYGNGLIPISQFLVNDLGVRLLGCASLGEALELIHEVPTLKSKILVFSDTELQNEHAREAYLKFNVIPVLHQASDLDVVLKQKEFSKLPLVLKLNTGMNRLGLLEPDLIKYLPLLKVRGISHLMTHFARSSSVITPGDKSHKQMDEFHRMKKILIDGGVTIETTSVSNSGAIEQQFGVSETYVRPGLMLYGPPSVTEPILWNGSQTSRWITKINSSFLAKKGTPVGYGVNVADKDSYFAVIPIGYGDGFFTFYSGTRLLVNGVPAKVFGRINMDLTFLQFDPEDAGKIKNGDVIEIWNHDNKVITDIANQNKTHAYQLMCGVSSRIPRIYKVN